ncbi:MAG: LuxR C-terminal-related transcriptional regulator [Aeromicrobium sp.]
MTIESLDLDGIAMRAREHLRAPLDDESCELLLEVTGGVPFLLDAALSPGGDVDSASGAVSLDPRTVRTSAVRSIQLILDEMSADQRRLLLAIAVSATADAPVLGRVLDISDDKAAEGMFEAKDAGLVTLDPSGRIATVLPLAFEFLLSRTEDHELIRTQQLVLDAVLARGPISAHTARALTATRCTDPRLIDSLILLSVLPPGENQVPVDELIELARRAGAKAVNIAARRAEAATAIGNFDLALVASDEVLLGGDSPDLPSAVRSAAIVYAHRGMLSRSAELFRYLGADRIGSDATAAAWSMIGCGDLKGARPMLAASSQPAPSSVAGGLSLMAKGLGQTLTGDGTSSLPTLVQAAFTMLPAGGAVVLPDTPAALAAIVALHCGELATAESTLQKALDADLGGSNAHPRHQLLLAWTAMLRGDLVHAAEYVDDVVQSVKPEPRDELFVHGLRVGIARRSSDLAAIADSWSSARNILPGHSMDLYSLLPLGEMSVVAARLQDGHRIIAQLDQANQLLEGLKRPALWSAAFHWYGVHAAILAEKPVDLIPHADALVSASHHSRYAAVLATAGQAWLRVLQDDIDPSVVLHSVHSLQQVGLPWDASRLAAQAAARTTDRNAMLLLLQTARSAQRFGLSEAAPSASSSTGQSNKNGRGGTQLSEREWEVAHLVLHGNSYRQIGERLFISPKTVEHHVARIRRRIGAESRAEMLETLRQLAAANTRPMTAG